VERRRWACTRAALFGNSRASMTAKHINGENSNGDIA